MDRFFEEIMRSLRRAQEEGYFVSVYCEPEDVKSMWIGQVRKVDEQEVVLEIYADTGMPNGFICHLTEEIWRIDEHDAFLKSMAARASIWPPSREEAPDAMDRAIEHAYQQGEVLAMCIAPEGYQPHVVLEMKPGRDDGWLRVARVDLEDGKEIRTSLIHYDDVRGISVGTRLGKTLTRLRQGI